MKLEKLQIALFGGSFNPIHLSHLKIIKTILRKKLVDEVWIIPCKKHPFDKSLANENHRLKMIRLAIKKIKNIKTNKIELKSKGKNYTLKTLRKLRAKYKHKFFLVIGSDILHEIHKWYKYKQLLKETKFVVFKRKGHPIKKVPGMKIRSLIKNKEKNISSTEIRKKVKEGKSLKNLVPKEIAVYIRKKYLYI